MTEQNTHQPPASKIVVDNIGTIPSKNVTISPTTDNVDRTERSRYHMKRKNTVLTATRTAGFQALCHSKNWTTGRATGRQSSRRDFRARRASWRLSTLFPSPAISRSPFLEFGSNWSLYRFASRSPPCTAMFCMVLRFFYCGLLLERNQEIHGSNLWTDGMKLSMREKRLQPNHILIYRLYINIIQ